MSIVQTRSITELRATLEGFAARHAALRVQEGASPQQLLDRFAEMEQAAQKASYQKFAIADRNLHRSIVELADVPALLDAWTAAFQVQEHFRIQTLRKCWPDLLVLLESHRDMVDWVAAGEPGDAEEAAVSHLDAVWFRLASSTDSDHLPSDPLARACAWLAFNYTSPVRLPALATDIAGCSGGHLARQFREKLGLSFSDYVLELRMQKAARLLQRSERAIQDIARQVGYADPSRFATHFQRHFGKTPTSFRGTVLRNQPRR